MKGAGARHVALLLERREPEPAAVSGEGLQKEQRVPREGRGRRPSEVGGRH